MFLCLIHVIYHLSNSQYTRHHYYANIFHSHSLYHSTIPLHKYLHLHELIFLIHMPYHSTSNLHISILNKFLNFIAIYHQAKLASQILIFTCSSNRQYKLLLYLNLTQIRMLLPVSSVTGSGDVSYIYC